jgi:hypothetical protein
VEVATHDAGAIQADASNALDHDVLAQLRDRLRQPVRDLHTADLGLEQLLGRVDAPVCGHGRRKLADQGAEVVRARHEVGLAADLDHAPVAAFDGERDETFARSTTFSLAGLGKPALT